MSNFEKLSNWFSDKGRVLVALSGGVDSALVAYAAHSKLDDSCYAVTANYQTLSQEELDSANKICSEIGIQQIKINYDELENDDFVRNDKNRCFFCRSELAEHLLQLAEKYEIDTIVDGTNLDDLGDYRPGLVALQENGIRSPLVEIKFTKDLVRNEAKRIGLSVHDKPSNSCLASRIPWGQKVTKEKLVRIELAESFIKKSTSAKQVRVRDIQGTAKIELEKQELSLLSNKPLFEKIKSGLQLFGFSSVVIDPDGYSPGKINVIVD